MTHPLRAQAGFLAITYLTLACASEQQDEGTCVPGQSVQCAGIDGCTGAQSCSADGSGYAPCVCGATHGGAPPKSSSGGLGQGGSGATTRQSSGGTDAISSSASSGRTSVGGSGAVGGTGLGGTSSNGGTSPLTTAGNTTCTPAEMAGFGYPEYVPARQLRGSCTEQSIRQYYSDCIANDSCAAYEPGGAEAKCGACLSPTELDSKSYGPLLKAGNTWFYFFEVNVAGCQELVGEVECAPKIQTEFLCRYNSCAGNCPLVDFAAFDPLMQCMNQADSAVCAEENSAANCLKDSNNYYSCWGSGFQSQFLAVARVYCL